MDSFVPPPADPTPQISFRRVAQFAYDGSQLLTIFEIKLNGADFFFFSKHVSSPESPGNRPHPQDGQTSWR